MTIQRGRSLRLRCVKRVNCAGKAYIPNPDRVVENLRNRALLRSSIDELGTGGCSYRKNVARPRASKTIYAGIHNV